MNLKNNTQVAKPLPMWARLVRFLVIPILLVLIGTQTWQGCNHFGPPPPNPPIDMVVKVKVTGTAYNKTGTRPISRAVIKLMDYPGQESTGSDASFTFNVRLSLQCTQLKIGILPDGEEEFITILEPVELKEDEKTVELGAVEFPYSPKKKIKTPLSTSKPPQQTLYFIKILFPIGVINPKVEIDPPAEVQMAKDCCMVSTPPGQLTIKLRTNSGVWEANFSHVEKVVESSRFTHCCQ